MKLQISAIFEGAFKFLFANILAIIGIAWLPYTVAILVTGLAIAGAIPAQWWHSDFSPMTDSDMLLMVPKFMGLTAVVTFTWLVTASMVTVGVQRRALGLSSGPVFAYFSLAAPVWRLIAANLLLLVSMIGIFIGIVVVCVLIGIGAQPVLSQNSVILIEVLLGIAGWCGFFYVAVRWPFFIAPVVVAEDHIGLARAWHLGQGNFWRIFAITIAISLSVSLAGGSLTQVFLSIFGGGEAFSNFPEHPTQAEVWTAVHQLGTALLPAFAISTLIQMIALAGVSNAAQALAYRQMTASLPPPVN